ncbi:unnamed protein product, partial [Phaeothamnion confervicola]
MSHALFVYFLNLARAVAHPVVWLVLLVCTFVPIEQLFALHPKKIWRKESALDLCYFFINSLVPAAIMAFPLLALSKALQGANPGALYSAVAALPLWVKLPVTLIISDIGAYWAHRAFHHFPWLWRFHAIHHSPESLDWLVNTRAHPFELVVTRMCALVPVYLLGFAQVQEGHVDSVVLWLQVLGTLWTFFIHANLRIRLGPLEWVVSSPAFHHWHHTNDEHRHHNFAALFPFIDKMFGTAWLPKFWPPGYGISQKVP